MKVYEKTQKDIEIALAWARGIIGTVEVSKMANLNGRNSIYTYLAICLRQYLLQELPPHKGE